MKKILTTLALAIILTLSFQSCKKVNDTDYLNHKDTTEIIIDTIITPIDTLSAVELLGLPGKSFQLIKIFEVRYDLVDGKLIFKDSLTLNVSKMGFTINFLTENTYNFNGGVTKKYSYVTNVDGEYNTSGYDNTLTLENSSLQCYDPYLYVEKIVAHSYFDIYLNRFMVESQKNNIKSIQTIYYKIL